MIFEAVANGGCRSYFIACEESAEAVVIDPIQARHNNYVGLAQRHGVHVKYVVDTHTHADHFSASRALRRELGAPLVMHRLSPAKDVDIRLEDGEMLVVGALRLRALHTPGHTRDSMCIVAGDRVFTGDTLLIGGTGRTDLPSGDPEQLYDSLFGKLLTLDPATRVYPAHDYKGRESTTIGEEIASNPRLQKRERAAFVAMMQELNLSAPDHLTEALRTNMNAGRTVDELLGAAAAKVPFISMDELAIRVAERRNDYVLLDVREKDAFAAGHVPGARHLPRGQLELRVNAELTDPTMKIVTICEFGKISTLAAATLRDLGFVRACALEGGMKAWRDAGRPLEA